MKTIMILGASIWQLPAIRKAKELGLNVVVADMNPNALGFREEGIFREVISTIDTLKIIDAAKKHKINGIITVASDMPMRTVAAVAKELNLVGISEETAFRTTNKGAMRRCLKEHKIPIPLFIEVYSENDYVKAVNSITGDKIVKPTDNAGSRGVSLLKADSSNKQVREAYFYARESSRSGGVMVEEYMEGPEVSVETLSFNGKCHVIQITDKLTTGSPHFVEMGHNEPSMLPNYVQEKIKSIAIDAVNAVGIENGPSHTEVKITPTGVKIVELGARLGGDFITTDLVPLSTGVDMVENCIKIALGESPDLTRMFNKGSAIRYMQTGLGRIQNVLGLDDAYAIPGVREVSLIHGIGDMAVEVHNSVDRVGFVIAQQDTPEQAIKTCEKALEKINVIVGD